MTEIIVHSLIFAMSKHTIMKKTVIDIFVDFHFHATTESAIKLSVFPIG